MFSKNIPFISNKNLRQIKLESLIHSSKSLFIVKIVEGKRKNISHYLKNLKSFNLDIFTTPSTIFSRENFFSEILKTSSFIVFSNNFFSLVDFLFSSKFFEEFVILGGVFESNVLQWNSVTLDVLKNLFSKRATVLWRIVSFLFLRIYMFIKCFITLYMNLILLIAKFKNHVV